MIRLDARVVVRVDLARTQKLDHLFFLSFSLTVSLVSRVRLACKLWASIAPLVEQLQRLHLHILAANDLS